MANYQPASIRYKFQNVRICYCHLRSPGQIVQDNGQKSDPKYSVTVLLDKDEHAALIAEVEVQLQELAKQAWGPKGDVWLNKNMLWNPLRDGDEAREGKPGFDNAMFVSASTKPRGFKKGDNTNWGDLAQFSKYPGPALAYVDTDEGMVVKIGDSEFDFNEIYAGCRAHVSVDFATYKHPSGGKGITAYLRAVLKIEDGDRLDGGGMAKIDDEFEDEIAALQLNGARPPQRVDEPVDVEDLDDEPIQSTRSPRRS